MGLQPVALESLKMMAFLAAGATAAQALSHLAFSSEGSPFALMILGLAVIGASARRRRVERNFA